MWCSLQFDGRRMSHQLRMPWLQVTITSHNRVIMWPRFDAVLRTTTTARFATTLYHTLGDVGLPEHFLLTFTICRPKFDEWVFLRIFKFRWTWCTMTDSKCRNWTFYLQIIEKAGSRSACANISLVSVADTHLEFFSFTESLSSHDWMFHPEIYISEWS